MQTYIINVNLSFAELTNHQDSENLGKALVRCVGWSEANSFLYWCFQLPIDCAPSYFSVVHLLHSEFIVSCLSRIQVLDSNFKLLLFLSGESQLEKNIIKYAGNKEVHCAVARCHEQFYLVEIL